MTKTNTIKGVVLSVLTGLIYLSFCSPTLANTSSQPLSYVGLTFSASQTTSIKDLTRTRPLTLTFTQPVHLTIEKSTTSSRLKTKLRTIAVTQKDPQVQVEAEVISQKATPTALPTPTTSTVRTTMSSGETTPTPQAVLTANTVSLENSGGLNADKLFSMVNAYRATLNLPPYQKDERSCQLAKERAPEIAQEIASGTMHKGMYDRNLPYWNTENIITMRTEEKALNWWLNDYIHKKQIEGPYKYSCTACAGNACAQEFTDFTAK